jgi:transcription elongation factor S-II
LVEQEKKAKTTKLSSPAPAATPSPATPSATLPTPNGGAKKKFTGDAEKRKYTTDGVDIQRTDSATRNGCIGLVYNGLAYRSVESSSDVIARAVSVEHAAFVKYKGETPDYKKKIRSLALNLKEKSNKELGVRVMTGVITPDKFVIMTDEELKSESLRKLDEEAEDQNIKNAQMAKGEKSYSDVLECGRCKKKMVSYTQAQTRSADEPMTTFCECMNCGKRWKVSYSPRPPLF